MKRNTSISLGPHFETFVREQVASGRFETASEVIRAGLRLLEDDETKLASLRAALVEGEESGWADYSVKGVVTAARKRKGSSCAGSA